MATKVVSSSSSTTTTTTSSVAITLAFAGRTARACDVCATRSALWYCAADEAYLCTACDTQVHSANAVSQRHDRVRLSPNGTPKRFAAAASHLLIPEDALGAHHDPAASSRKRSRAGTSRAYSHHLRKLTRLSNQLASRDVVKVEESNSSCFQAELELFDFLDADEFLNDGNQEVPSLDVDKSGSPCCSSDLDQFVSSDYDQEGDQLAKNSADSNSFAAFFKGKAAHSLDVISDQFLVPDAAFNHFRELDIEVTATAPADTDIDLGAAGDGFFFPGDIPGFDVGFESFVPEVDLVDDFSLSFDLALQNGLDAFEGNCNVAGGAVTSERTGVAEATQECKTKPTETTPHNDFLAGPFAQFFAQKSKTDSQEDPVPMDPERIKREAREMLQCCREGEGEDEAQNKNNILVPSLQLNFKDVLAAWSDREEPWILGSTHDDSTSSGSDDTGLVPDMDGDRDARVLRYKEKRRSRLFSKTIRYEVRKVNAERRPRMKGRFVKRTTATSSS